MMRPKQRMCRRLSIWPLFIFLAIAAETRALAGTPSISLAAGSGAPGAQITLTVSLATNGTLPAAVQWDLIYTSTDLGPAGGTFYATGAAATAAGKQASCNTVFPGDVRCIVAGLNSTTISDGVLATLTFQISSTTANSSSQITFSGLTGTDASANPITVNGTGATVT